MRKPKPGWRRNWRMAVSAAEAAADAKGEWTPELVLERLREAAKVAAVCVGSPFPSSKVVATLETWREVCPELSDAKPRRKYASPSQVSMMEEAIGWMADHVRCNKARAMLSQLAAARTLGGNFRAVCKARGWSRSYAYEVCNVNLRAIAGALNRGKVPVRL